ncbi:hypothetical protein IMY05_C4852000400 [Salix suchowensis]|nr:hypothetical protein IMY05_C4852000400 [Salix suchowensis]
MSEFPDYEVDTQALVALARMHLYGRCSIPMVPNALAFPSRPIAGSTALQSHGNTLYDSLHNLIAQFQDALLNQLREKTEETRWLRAGLNAAQGRADAALAKLPNLSFSSSSKNGNGCPARIYGRLDDGSSNSSSVTILQLIAVLEHDIEDLHDAYKRLPKSSLERPAGMSADYCGLDDVKALLPSGSQNKAQPSMIQHLRDEAGNVLTPAKLGLVQNLAKSLVARILKILALTGPPPCKDKLQQHVKLWYVPLS